MFVKVYVVDAARRILRWSILAHDDRIPVVVGDSLVSPIRAGAGGECGSGSSSSSDTADIALIIGIAGVVVGLLSLGLVGFMLHKMKSLGQAAILAASVNRYTDSPDYWQS